jgi:hypothetical protein
MIEFFFITNSCCVAVRLMDTTVEEYVVSLVCVCVCVCVRARARARECALLLWALYSLARFDVTNVVNK